MKHAASRLDFLDAARGISILGVIAVHTVQNFPTGMRWLDVSIGTGQFGVQLFYMVSAYTMQHTFEARVGRERSPVRNFWTRRFWRLAVPFWAGMCVYEGFRAAGTGYYISTTDDLYSVLTSFFLVQGFWPSSLSSVIPGGGTIAAEAIFYVFFPLIFLLGRNVIWLAMFGIVEMLLDHAAIRPLYLALFSRLHSGFSVEEANVFFYFYIFNQFPSFLVGIYFYIVKHTGFRRWHLAGLIPFILLYFTLSPKLAAINLLGWVLLYGLSVQRRFPRWLIGTGRISYSLYLFHFAVLNFMILISARYAPEPGIPLFLVGYLIAVLLTTTIGRFTKPLLEDTGSLIGRLLVERGEQRAVIATVEAPSLAARKT